jgi:hypothetical protein
MWHGPCACTRVGMVTLDTGPPAPATHWRQMVFHLSSPIDVTAGGSGANKHHVRGAMKIVMSGRRKREMTVHLAVTAPEQRVKTFTVREPFFLWSVSTMCAPAVLVTTIIIVYEYF